MASGDRCFRSGMAGAAFAVFFMASTVVSAHPDDAVASGSETLIRGAVESNPDDVAARNKLGFLLAAEKKYDEAEKEFREVLRRSPVDFGALDGMGLVMTGRGKYDDALAWFAKAVSVRTEDTFVHVHRGRALEKAGKIKEAEAAYLEALAVNDRLAGNPGERERRKAVKTALSRIREKLRTPEADGL